MGVIYLIHFDEPVAHAQHYLGYTDDLEARIKCHQKGHGARLIAHLVATGVSWRVVRTWEGERALERALKNLKKARVLCPCCNPERWETNGNDLTLA